MKAAVEAQALAAQSTIEFIQKVGFTAPASNKLDPPNAILADPSQPARMGQLRNVTFTYQKKDENNTLNDYSLAVPLLAIVPIPYLRIDEVTIDFDAKLTDAVTQSVNTSFRLDTNVSGSFSSFWSPVKMEFRASSTYSRDTASSATQQREYNLKIRVRAVQDKMPAGLERVLAILEAAIKEDPQKTKAPG